VSDYDKEEELMVYVPLIKKLRTMASRAGLSNVELLQEFEVFKTNDDPSCSGECICGHKGTGFTSYVKKTILLKSCITKSLFHLVMCHVNNDYPTRQEQFT
jgi:hypothetical protein